MFPLVLAGLAVGGVTLSAFRDPARTRRALAQAGRSGLNLLPSLLALTAGIGLTLALIPPSALARLFHAHGILGFGLLAGVGSLLTIPGPVAYPLAGSLHQLGASLPALATFITTLTMVGLLTAPLEVKAFGRRFTLLRQAFSLGLALLIGALMGVLL
ncbi:MAG: permease [Acidobacteria bacterium]|nr:permease [Acidobacteriota bacterium]